MHEAEAYCALMAVRGEVAAVLTNDTDAVAYGAPLVGCNYGTDAEFAADFAEALRATRLTHAAFLDACLLCGSDANNRIPGVGPQTAFRLMQKHGIPTAVFYPRPIHVQAPYRGFPVAGGGLPVTPVTVDASWPAFIYERRCPESWFRPREDAA